MKAEETRRFPLDRSERRGAPRRLLAKKLGLAMGSSLGALLALELASWMAGLEPAFHREDPYSGFSRHVPHFVRAPGSNEVEVLTVAPNKKKVLNPQSFKAEKPPGTYRIVCVGGSSTYGRPFFDSTSYPGWLRETLPAIQPSRNWEVINAGAISYASYRDVGLMEELAQYSPDLFVVYTGHNEFLERRTYAGLADRSPWVTSALSLVSRTRTATLIRGILDRSGVHRIQTAHRAPILGEDTKSIAVNAVGTEAYHRDEAFSQDVVEHFTATLHAMVDCAERAKAEIVFVVPASNLADFEPFKSEHRSGLSDKDLARWNRHFSDAQEHWSAGRQAEALQAIGLAVAIDEQFAAVWYWKGKILQGTGDPSGAKVAFERARDEDVCPLRAIGAIGRAVREVGRRRGKSVVDFEEVVAHHSDHGLPGRALFHDHVHLSIEANRLMSLAVVDRLREMGIVKSEGVWDAAAIERVKAKVEGGIDLGRHAGELRLLAVMLGWLKQTALARYEADLSLELSGSSEENILDLATRWRENGAPELAVEFCQRAVATNGMSARLWSGLGIAQLDAGNATEGIRALERAIAIQPDDGVSLSRLGIALANRGELEEASTRLKEAVRLRPNSGVVRGNFGLVLARQGKLQEAIEQYSAALELDPGSPSVHFNLGQALEGLGDTKGATEHYRSALRSQPNHAKAQERLVAMSGSAGRLDP